MYSSHLDFKRKEIWGMVKKIYLYTLRLYGTAEPISHGQVTINDEGWIDGEIPIEDYGMWFYGEEPFEGDVFQAFLDLLFESENIPLDYCGMKNFHYDPNWKLEETPIGKYLKISEKGVAKE